MGTNYYAVPDPCPLCHRGDERIHIGKTLVNFQGYDESPWGRIDSWADWKAVLLGEYGTPTLIIVDEYGERHAPEEFVSHVEETRFQRRVQHFNWILEHAPERARVVDSYGDVVKGTDWLDDEGFSFTSEEFT